MARRGGSAWRVWAVLIVVVGVSASCGRFSDDDGDVDALSMSKAEVSRIIVENLNAVDPSGAGIPYDTPTGGVDRAGCAGGFPSSMPSGPPWRYVVRRAYDNPDAARISQLRTSTEGLVAKGFAIERPPDTRDPRDVTVSDSRGFSVGLFVDESQALSRLRVTIESRSPCVRHPDPDEDR